MSETCSLERDTRTTGAASPQLSACPGTRQPTSRTTWPGWRVMRWLLSTGLASPRTSTLTRPPAPLSTTCSPPLVSYGASAVHFPTKQVSRRDAEAYQLITMGHGAHLPLPPPFYLIALVSIYSSLTRRAYDRFCTSASDPD